MAWVTLKGETWGVTFLRQISIITFIAFDLEQLPLAMWHVRKGRALGGAPASPNFWYPTYAHTVWHSVTKFGTITHVGDIKLFKTSYICGHNMRSSTQSLHSDQTRCEDCLHQWPFSPGLHESLLSVSAATSVRPRILPLVCETSCPWISKSTYCLVLELSIHELHVRKKSSYLFCYKCISILLWFCYSYHTNPQYIPSISLPA